MFTYKHYVPILKAKEGEFKALQETAEATKDMMTPLFEIMDVPWDYQEGAEGKTIDEHLNKIGKKISECWGERRIFVDSPLIAGNRKMMDNSTHHFEFLFNDFRSKGLNTIPTAELSRHNDYKRAIKSIVQTDEKGICLRLFSADIANASLKAIIDNDLAFYEVSPKESDLIIDLEHISNDNQDLLTLTISTFINNVIPYINDWRSITLAETAFPTNLSEIDADTIDAIERGEWQIWNKLLSRTLNRIPSFGDYSIANPEVLDLDPRNMRVSASIRYTCDEYWLIVRGRWLRKYGYDQYHNLCKNLILRTEYCGPTFSWADNYINECAAETVGAGNPTTWRKVGNNHHFQKVFAQISSLP